MGTTGRAAAQITSLAMSLTLQLTPAASAPDPFAYAMKATPEDGPRDPTLDKRHTAQFNACQKRAIQTRENEACFQAEFNRQDAVLNTTWKATLARLEVAKRAPLLAAQRKWIAARDRFCKAQSDKYRGGSIEPVIYIDCRVEQTIRRTIWLEALT